MRVGKRCIGLALLAVAFVLPIAISTGVSAYVGEFGSPTYFNGINVDKNGRTSAGDYINWIGAGGPSSSYVMQNRYAPRYAGYGGDTGQGGAIGWLALNNNGSDSVITDNAVRKRKLFELLQRANKGSDSWDKMGSALIVHQMLQKPKVNAGWGDGARTIKQSEWNDLENRFVNNPDIIMTLVPDYSVVGKKNTTGVVYRGAQDIIDWTITGKEYLDTGYEYAWVFTENGETRYVLEVNCANPIGGFGGFPPYNPPPTIDYSLTPGITLTGENTAIKRGNSVSGTTSVTKSGSTDSYSVNWRVTRFIYAPGTTVSDKGAKGVTGNNPCSAFSGSGRTACDVVSGQSTNQVFSANRSRGYTYTIPSGTAFGSSVCFVTSVSRPTHTSAATDWRHSQMRCVTVAFPEYDLVPRIRPTMSDGSVVEPGARLTVGSSVENTGDDDSRSTLWRLTRMIYSPSTTLNSSHKRSRTSNSDPCAEFLAAPGRICESARTDRNEVFRAGRTVNDSNVVYSVPDNFEVGTKVCFAASVNTPTYSNNPAWGHSAWWCVIVGKKPKMQVWGGDVRSGGRIGTSTSTIGGRTYGSWSEYAALSHKRNSGFASGAGLVNGSSSASQSSWSRLTFANTGGSVSCTFGCYNFSLSGSTVASQFTATSSNPTPPSSTVSLSGLNGVYRAGNLRISTSHISSGRTVIIVATGTVTIEGDITYEDRAYSNPRDIPQVVIKAPKIDIQNSAGRVDAWLLATNDTGGGVLNTCSNYVVSEALSASRCNNRLRINGPVVADTIHLRRTAGSESHPDGRGNPAEEFNLRADAYLWASAYNRTSANQVQTVYTKELSPRF